MVRLRCEHRAALLARGVASMVLPLRGAAAKCLALSRQVLLRVLLQRATEEHGEC